MRELRANAKAPSFERLAVLTAISVAHEFLLLRKQHEGQEQQLTHGLAALRSKLDAALETDAPKR
jgi:cell division protein ZapA